MRRIATLLALVAVVVAAARDTLAARATPHLNPLEAALQQRVADEVTPKKLKKLFGRNLKRLGKTTTTLTQDVASAAAILPAIEKKAGADAALLAVAGATVDGLTGAVALQLVAVQAEADTLQPKSPLYKIGKLLGRGQAALTIALAPGSIASRFRSLRTASVSTAKADKVVQKVMNGPGGGGGGGLCGPTPRPSGLRALAQNESFALHLDFGTEEFDFAAETVVAKVGPAGGITGQPKALEIRVFDCTRNHAAMIAIPFPPIVDREYVDSQFGGDAGVSASYGAFEGLTQLFLGAHVKATAFDPQAKTITIEFSWGGSQFTNGHATIRNWTGQ